MDAVSLRDMATDAVRYWEPLRLLYNGLLTVVVLAHLTMNWPMSREAVTLNAVLGLFVLAVLANVAYCAAYIVDLFLQISHFREQRRVWRAGLAMVGLAFAAVLTHFIASGFFAAGIIPSID